MNVHVLLFLTGCLPNKATEILYNDMNEEDQWNRLLKRIKLNIHPDVGRAVKKIIAFLSIHLDLQSKQETKNNPTGNCHH